MVTAGQNRAEALGGNGSSIMLSALAADFSGRHVSQGIFTAADVTAGMDGTLASSTAVVMASSNSRFRLFAFCNPSASSFFKGGVQEAAVCAALTLAERAAYVNYLTLKCA